VINFKSIELQNVVAHSKGRTKYLIEGQEYLAEEAAIRYYRSFGLNAI
jgi:hypothetical protein